MLETLHHLFAEQTTPLELINFIVVVAVLSVATAAMFYVLLMTVVWSLRLRPEVKYRHVFLPTGEHLRVFFWEYALAATTSIVLGVTLIEKHEIVDAVLATEVSTLDEHLRAALFPLHRLPNGAELGESDLSETDFVNRLTGRGGAGGTVLAASILKPVLEAGRAAEVKSLVDDLVLRAIDAGGFRPYLRLILMTLSAGLIVAYLLWFARKRFRGLKGDAKARVDYKDTLRSLFVVGVCVALLLASPAMVKDRHLIAESALGVLRHAEPDSSPVAMAIKRSIDSQYELQGSLRALAGMTDETSVVGMVGRVGARSDTALTVGREVSRSLDRVERSVESVSTELADLRNRMGGEIAGLRDGVVGLERTHQADIDNLRRSIERVAAIAAGFNDSLSRATSGFSTSIRDLNRRLALVQDGLEELNGAMSGLSGEIVIVQGSPRVRYEIRQGSPNGSVVGTGSPSGVHRLPPGNYVITGVSVLQRFRLATGSPRWFAVSPPVQ